MKTLRVNDLLIVDVEAMELAKLMLSDNFFPNLEKDLICKGSELTEDISKEFVKSLPCQFSNKRNYRDYSKEHKFPYDAYLLTTALKSFKSLIESQGYYWGENNLPIPSSDNINWFRNQINGDFSDRYTSVFNWHEAQSKTFNLEQTLIFKIVE